MAVIREVGYCKYDWIDRVEPTYSSSCGLGENPLSTAQGSDGGIVGPS